MGSRSVPNGANTIRQMRLALELARAEFRRYSTYRAATVSGLFTNTVFGFLRAAVLIAALKATDGGVIGGYGRRDALTYTWLTQALLMTIVIWNWNDIAVRVQTGDIATDVVRPFDMQLWWMARDYGRAAYQVSARGVAMMLIGSVMFDLLIPTSAQRWLAFTVSVALAVMVSYAMRFIVNLCVFWTLDWRGVSSAHNLCMSIFSGMAVPVAFFPKWIAHALRALPWYQALQAPIDVFLAKGSMSNTILLQLLWAGALLILGRFVLAGATRRLVVQGG